MTPGSKGRSSSSDLRERLIEAALEILKEPETPLDLRKVAERAGKSRTAPYLVFGKESEGGGLLALRIAVAAHGARELNAQMEDAALGVDDPIEALRRVALAFLHFVDDNGRLFRLMYGPEISAVQSVGEEGFREHPEFRALLDFRSRAGFVISDLIHRGQERALLRPEPYDEAFDPGGFLDTPRARYLQIAWATMIGVAFLRDDQLLQAVGWQITPEQGARLIVESVFGLDPQRVGGAAASFLASEAADRPSAERTPPPAPESPLFDEESQEAFVLRQASAPIARSMSMAPPPTMAAPPNLEPELSLTQALNQNAGLRRAAFSDKIRNRARILWIDDHPDWIEHEVATLRQLGADVTVVRNTHGAIRALQGVTAAPTTADGTPADAPEARSFQVILSDIARGSRRDAGTRALPELRRLAPGVPVVFFVGDLDPSLGVPEGAAGITNRADELLHLVVDALEGR